MHTHKVRPAGGRSMGLAGMVAGLLAWPATSVAAPVSFTLSPDGAGGYDYFDFDYTVPPDGQTYLWTFSFTSADPAATIFLEPPNQLDGIDEYETATGPSYVEAFDPSYVFKQTLAPGLLSIVVSAQAQYDDCTPGVVSATVPCGDVIHVWGNGTTFTGSSADPVFVTFATTPLPEPPSWALTLAGVGVVGAGLRRRRPQAA